MDSFLVWSSEPQRQLYGLPWLQRAASDGDLHHPGGLAEVRGGHQRLGGRGSWLGGCGNGDVSRAVLRGGWARRGGGVLAAEREEVRVRGRHPEAAQSYCADVTELHVSFFDLTTQQSGGELQEEHLQTQTHNFLLIHVQTASIKASTR